MSTETEPDPKRSTAPPARRDPINLTAAAERRPWSEAKRVFDVPPSTDGPSLGIVGLDDVEAGWSSPGVSDTVYVIVSGYGVLHCGDAAMECTMGDVVFVPRGRAHHFERRDGVIRIWRISSAPTTGVGGDEPG